MARCPCPLARRTALSTASRSRHESPAHRVEERRAAEGLLEEGESASLETLTAGLVVVSRQNDGWHARADCGQMPQEVQASHPRHPQVDHETAGLLPMIRLQERLRGDERLHMEAHRSQEIAERSTEGRVVIDDDHVPVERTGLCPQES